MLSTKNDFEQWLKKQHPSIVLVPAQNKLVDAYCEMGGRGAGKTFVLDLLQKYDASQSQKEDQC